MDPDSDSSGSDEYFDVEDVELNIDHVSRFLAMLDDGTKVEAPMAAQQLHHTSSISETFQTEKTSSFEPFTSTLKRPSCFHKPVDSAYSSLPRQHLSKPGEIKLGTYVSEMQISLSPQLYPESPSPTGNQSVQNETGTSVATQPPPGQQLGKVEYVSGIQVIHSGPGNHQKPSSLTGSVHGIRRENAVTTLTNFLSKLSQDTSNTTKFPNSSLTPITSNIPSSEGSGSSDFFRFPSPNEITPSPVDRPKLSLCTSRDQAQSHTDPFLSETLPTYDKKENTVFSAQVVSGFVNGQGFVPLASPTSKVTMIKEKLSPTASTPPANGTIQFPESDSRCQLPEADEPPPLPKNPPPVLLSGPTLESITSEDADFLTSYLMSLKTGEIESSKEEEIWVLPQSIGSSPTELSIERQEAGVKQPKKQLVIPKTVSTNIVSKQAPKMCRSPGLPKWPPAPQSPSAEFSKEEHSDSSFDAQDVELRGEGARGGAKEKLQGSNNAEPSNNSTASWDTGYSGSNTASQISCEPPEGEDDERLIASLEELKKQEEDQTVIPERTSIMDLLRSNSSAGRKSKPRWQSSVPDFELLEGLSEKRVQLLELEFEIITTEAEYFSRVDFLVDNFIVDDVSYNTKVALGAESKKNIFQDLEEVSRCSQKLLDDLDSCWKRSVFLVGIFDIITEHSRTNINAFINYCAGYEQVVESISVHRKTDRKLERIVNDLEEGKPDLREQLREPMGRIMQLQLLLKNCCKVMAKLVSAEDSADLQREYESCQEATASVTQVCSKVDEVTGLRRRVQKIFEVQNSLEFPPEMTPVSLTSQSRWLVKKGPLTQIGSLVLTDGRVSFKKSSALLTVFLFNDLIILTKKRSDICHVVRDYGWRPGVALKDIEGVEGLPSRLAVDSPGYFPIFLSILKNNMGNTAYVFLSCAQKTDRCDWLEAMNKTTDEFHGL